MDRIGTHILAFTGEDRAVDDGVAIEGSGDATGRVLFEREQTPARNAVSIGAAPTELIGVFRVPLDPLSRLAFRDSRPCFRILLLECPCCDFARPASIACCSFRP